MIRASVPRQRLFTVRFVNVKHDAMIFTLSLHILIGAANLAVGVYVLLKRPRSSINRSFFIFVVGIVGWIVGLSLLSLTERFLFVSLTFWSGELIVLGFVLLAEVFPDGLALQKKMLWLLGPWFAIVLLTPSRLFIASVQFNDAGYLEPENGVLFSLWAAIMGFYLLWGFFRLITKYRFLRGLHRVQMGYLLLGAGSFVTAGFIFDVLLPAFRIFRFNLLGPFFSLIFIGCIAYAIVRHRFMNIKVVIQRSFLYVSAFAAVALLFFVAYFFLQLFMHGEEVDEISDIIAAVVGVFGFPYFRRWFERLTDGIFFREDYEYSAAVRELGLALGSTIDPDDLVGRIGVFLESTVKPEWTAFIFGEHDGPVIVRSKLSRAENQRIKESGEVILALLRKLPLEPLFLQEIDGILEGSATHSADERNAYSALAEIGEKIHASAIVPMASKGELYSCMLLGKKLSDDIFRPKDIALLGVLSRQAGMAFENGKLYEDIRRSNEELERRVEQKTERIKAMYEVQSRFLTDISHELQTPIAIFEGNIALLESKKGGEAKSALRVVRTTLDGMSRLVGNLLEIGRLNFSKKKLHKVRVDVGKLLNEVREDCFVLAVNKEISITAEAEKSFVLVERRKLKEVLFNLVNNALEHTGPGGFIRLTAATNDGLVEIVVSDTGSGIPPEEASQIFERFYRIKGDESRGTGLGLNICREIIEAHGGTIRVESELGRGSRFIISLPAVSSGRKV